MRILFLTDNYPPEVNAPAVRTHFHCREWVDRGHHVTVLTCAPNFPKGEVYDGYRNRLVQREWLDGVEVVRVWSYMAPNEGVIKRILDYVSFAAVATLAGVAQEFDVVVATSPQLFTAVAGAAVARLRGRPWVMEVRDLWPESIVATGAMKAGFLIEALEHLEMSLYRSASLIVPVTQSFRTRISARGIPAGKIHVVPNGVDPTFLEAAHGALAESVPPAHEAGKPVFTVGYLGTLGMAHGLDLVLRAARRLDSETVRFVLVGEGADKARLVREACDLGLTNVEFREPVPRRAVPGVLAGFDACLVPLRDSVTFQTVLPSKIFEAAAALRPILLGVRGESRRLIETYDAGIAFEPESEVALVEAIRRLEADGPLYVRLQEGAARLAREFDRRPLAESMLTRIGRLVEGAPPASTETGGVA